jgi:hypothetical protein
MENMGQTNNKNDTGGTQVEERLAEVDKGLEKIGEAIKTVSNEVRALEGRKDSHRNDDTERDTQGAATFASIVAQAPARHADAVARVAMVNRQVVIECVAEAGKSSIANLTEKEILAKAKIAVEMLAKEGAKEAEDVQFIHARKTMKGGAILVTRTEEAARWLKREEVITHFAEKMGGTIHARADLCMVVAEYVPVTFEPELYSAFGQVEKASGLEKGAIREARYIKQKHHRRDGQRSAHMLIGLTSTEQANIAIRNGLVMEGKHVAIRRHRIDPQRCLKCQKIGVAHRAAECKSIHDTCGRCAGMHRTNDCTIANPDEFKCVNCDMAGHASVDRSCPTFCKKMKVTHAKFPDYRYRYFPTKDPATWETENYEVEEVRGAKDSEENAPATIQGYSGHFEPQARERYGGQGRGIRTNWQRDNGWSDMRSAPTRTGRGRGGSQSATGMHQGTLDTTFGTAGVAGRERERMGEQTGRRWGDEPMEEGTGPTRSQQSTELSYA